MTNDYKMGMFVIKYLKSIGLNILTIGHAIENNNLKKSFLLINNNPNIEKKEFLDKMKIEEVLY